MKWILRVVVGLVALATLFLGGLYAPGKGDLLILSAGLAFGAPDGEFDPAQTVPAPDYADGRYWAALPGSPDLADFVPEGISVSDTGKPSVDVYSCMCPIRAGQSLMR